MSFVIAVSRFLSVVLRDDAGADVTAFEIEPTPRTHRLMADYGILFRPVTGGMALYFKTNPDVSPALVSPITGPVRFSFAMTAKDSDPGRLYQGLSGTGGSHILLDNLDAGGAIRVTSGPITAGAHVGAGEQVFAGSNRYPVRVDLSGGVPDVIEARDRFTNAVAATTAVNDPGAEPPVAPPPGATQVFTTVGIPARGSAALRLFTPAPGTLDRLIYADEEIAAARAVGVIDLHWTGAQSAVPAGSGIEYEAVFLRQ